MSTIGWIANLPWYDLPELRDSNDRFWRALAESLNSLGFLGVPSFLERSRYYQDQWQDPNLLFSQACGFDVIIPKPVQLVATPSFSMPRCSGGNYWSHILVNADSSADTLEDLRDSRCVVNNETSHSGLNSLRELTTPLARHGRFFSSVTISGSHVESVRMIINDEADVAAIDCVMYEQLRRHRPAAIEGTRILMPTKVAPAPPYITSSTLSNNQLGFLQRVVIQTLAKQEFADLRRELMIEGAVHRPLTDYASMQHAVDAASESGYLDFQMLNADPQLQPTH